MIYDKYIVAFSGGKDSTACFLHLLDVGVPKDKIELWHHDIDGKDKRFMDWEITEDYCRKFAEAFGVPIYFSWKEGGFKREMMRDNERTAPMVFEDENHNLIKIGGDKGKLGTRKQFPQVSPDLSVRWCSAYLKIDVCSAAIRNQDRFKGIKTVVISGERGEESPNRGKYAILEPDRSDLRDGHRYQRYVDRMRPIRDWKEEQVWEIIEKYKVRVHPAYYLGFGRVSCQFCIFGNANQFRSAYAISPQRGMELADLEDDLGKTMKRKETLRHVYYRGEVYPAIQKDHHNRRLAVSNEYTDTIFMDNWLLPSGAFGESCGPT